MADEMNMNIANALSAPVLTGKRLHRQALLKELMLFMEQAIQREQWLGLS